MRRARVDERIRHERLVQDVWETWMDGISLTIRHAEWALHSLPCLRVILDAHPELINAPLIGRGTRLIHEAVRLRERPAHTVNFLVSRGADISVRDLGGWTPTAWAVEFLELAPLPALLEAGASIREWPHYGKRTLPLSITRIETRLARCRMAQRAVALTGRVHKDVLPAVLEYIWCFRRSPEWDTPEESTGSKKKRRKNEEGHV